MSIKQIYILLVVFALLVACNKGSFQVSEKGLEYLFIIKNENNAAANLGDVLTLQFRITDDKGHLIEESAVFRKQLDKPSHAGGSIEDALAMMHTGDSAIFKVDAENYYIKTRGIDLPNTIEQGSKLIFYIKLIKITSFVEFSKEREIARMSDEREEESLRNAFLKRANITTEPTQSGLYFIEIKNSKGDKPTPGKRVAVHYSGYFIDGRLFDSSYDRKIPFEFEYGMGQVIQGWEEALGMMHVGGKYKLVIPSYLAYGDKQFGPIPPNSTLVFDIELLRVDK